MNLIYPIKGVGTTPGIYISQKFGNVFILQQPFTYNGVTYPVGTNFYKAVFGMNGHNGIDYACPIGTPIYAEHDGFITATYNAGGYGNYIRLDFEEDGFGWQIIGGHLSKILKIGQVKQGEMIALSGNSGASTNPHYHRGLGQLKNGQILNYNNGYKGSIDPTPFTKGESMNQTKVVLGKDGKTVFICTPVSKEIVLTERAGVEGFAIPNPIPPASSL
jgi:murein DD-endopeptidase MepM/ murein hydrolase activator NlpD